MRTPPNESDRLKKLLSLKILDTPSEDLFDGITKLAAQICACPIATLSLIDSDREWIKSSIGTTENSVPRSLSLDSETILGSSPLILTELDNSAMRFYAGVPIITKDRYAIGVLSVKHTQEHTLTESQIHALCTLASQAANYIEMRADLTIFQSRVNALGESERRFRTIADASPMLLWISDEGGNRTFFNHAWCEFTGLSREESVADRWIETIHPDDREIYNRKWEEIAQQKIRFQQEFRLRHCSGTYRWVLEQAMPMFSSSGKLEGYVSSCLDLSSRMTDELQYQNNEARFRAISEAAPLGIFVTDSNGNYIYTNHQFQKITGQSAEESFGFGWQRALAPEDRERVAASWYAATRTAQPFEEVYRFRKINGEIAWASVKAAAINSTDIVSGWVGTVEDITARLKADAELIEAKQSAEAAMHAKSQFLANMSHEIRTPLTVILGFAEALRDEGEHTATELHCLDVILNNGRHLLDIINGILDLSKIDAGALAIERSSFDLIELIEDVRIMFAPRIAEKSLFFSVQYDWPLPKMVISDPLRVKQVLINLLSNAIKFTERGTIEMSIKHDREHGRLVFAVSDSGIGIESDKFTKLFKPFSQANESITRKFGGTGLGLNISAHLVHALGGEIEVESELNRGSTFTFSILVEIDEAAKFIDQIPPTENKPAHAPRQHPRFSGRVLFADDALDNRRLVDHLLRRSGIEPVLVEDGKQAIERALQEPFDLILLDVQMPNIDGLTAARTIRDSGISTPIVSLSAAAMESDVRKAVESGCCMHLAKPFAKDAFIKMLQRFLPNDPSEPQQLQSVISTKVSDDPEMNDLIIEFIDALPGYLQDLKGVCEASDWEAIEVKAHKLRGSSGLYGYKDLSLLCERLELTAKERSIGVATTLGGISEMIARILAGREALIERNVSLISEPEKQSARITLDPPPLQQPKH